MFMGSGLLQYVKKPQFLCCLFMTCADSCVNRQNTKIPIRAIEKNNKLKNTHTFMSVYSCWDEPSGISVITYSTPEYTDIYIFFIVVEISSRRANFYQIYIL